MKTMRYSLIKSQRNAKLPCTLLLITVALFFTACAQPRTRGALQATSNGKITALKSQADLLLFLDKIDAAKEMLGSQNQSHESNDTLDSITVTGSRIQSSDVITNNQVGGIDEGDIIKKSGRWLIHLHAGTLSVVDSEAPNQNLFKVAELDLASLNKGGEDVWYDELLVYQQHIVVLGFDYANSASQLDFIELTAKGELRPVQRYWISSDDYFSDSNYGTRILGDELLITLSHRLTRNPSDWPMLKRELNSQALPLVQVADLHLPAVPLSEPYAHWVIRCKLSNSADPIQNCKGSGVIGTAEKIHYISDTAVYFACADWQPAVYEKQLFHGYVNQLNERYQRTIVYRLPHSSSDAIGAQIFKGSIGNQFQMHEFQRRFFLLGETAKRHLMERYLQDWHLQMAPIDSFRAQPNTQDLSHAILSSEENDDIARFQDDWLWLANNRTAPTLIQQSLLNNSRYEIPISDWVERLEPTPVGMLAISSNGSREHLLLSLVSSSSHRVLNTHNLVDRDLSDSRSHAFNFGTPLGSGLTFGFPVDSYNNEEPASSLQFIQWEASGFRELGLMPMPNKHHTDDDVDWYGNARIFFMGPRIMGLSGLRLSEFSYLAGQLQERSFVHLNPDKSNAAD